MSLGLGISRTHRGMPPSPAPSSGRRGPWSLVISESSMIPCGLDAGGAGAGARWRPLGGSPGGPASRSGIAGLPSTREESWNHKDFWNSLRSNLHG
jgi:hypothetical protein